MGPRCSMNMLWNTQIIDTCVVFRSWHIHSVSSFVFSCLVIVALGVFYEYLRAYQKAFDHRIATSLATKNRAITGSRGGSRSGSERSSPEGRLEDAGLLNGRRSLKHKGVGTPVPPVFRALRALLYGITVFLSFFLMLVFMTYNAYLIFAVVAGAAIGHYAFSSHINLDAVLSDSGEERGMACH